MTSIQIQIAVVGGGPAGLAAAGEARAAGARVLLIEERPVLGGRAVVVPGARGLAEGLIRDLRSAEVWRGSTVWGIFGRSLAVLRAGRTRLVAADAVILATGALEWLVPFPGWTLGGVYTLEGAWELVRAGKVGPAAGPAVVVGGAEGASLAARMSERGAQVLMVSADRPKGLPPAIPVIPGRVAEARGAATVERVVLADGSEHECRMLCVESPREPLTDLARLAGAPCVYHPRLGGFVPRYDRTLALHGPTSELYIAGDSGGVDTPRAAAESGRLAARSALRELHLLPDPEAKLEESRGQLRAMSAPLCARARESIMIGAMPDDVVERWEGPPGTVLCPCQGVTLAALQAGLDDGARTPDELKRWTRCGMGVCQWRRCRPPVMQWLSGALEVPIGQVPLPRVRPPVRPVPLSAIAGLEGEAEALPGVDG
ncbi:MAG TPA: FAD-dependent oxidoreductase [bacterium]|nr:FAD-dependent oxidoreductase [bacterium]